MNINIYSEIVAPESWSTGTEAPAHELRISFTGPKAVCEELQRLLLDGISIKIQLSKEMQSYNRRHNG